MGEIDPTKAFQWHERAANLGSVDSMAEVGLCYELGCGAEQSDEEALDWYTKAAELGHATAKSPWVRSSRRHGAYRGPKRRPACGTTRPPSTDAGIASSRCDACTASRG